MSYLLSRPFLPLASMALWRQKTEDERDPLEAIIGWFPDHAFFDTPSGQWVGLLALALLASLVGLLAAWVLRRLLARLARRTKVEWDDRLVAESRGPVAMLVVLGVLTILWIQLPLHEAVQAALRLIFVLGFILAATWLAIRAVKVVAWGLEKRFVAEGDVSRSRSVRTQVLVLRKVATIVLVFVGVSLALLQFEVLRSIGTSVLASAGIVGLIVGLAAQKSISNLIAGLQLSITQPIRIDDTVIIENEWGFVEEITLTYVVVRVWDQRRLVVPVSRFLEQPFQNWTKGRPDLLGTVFLHADYRVPVEMVREEVQRLCRASDKWDGREWGLIVTDATEKTVQLRALVSAVDSGALWKLRCEVREGLVRFLQQLDGGRYLPRLRLEEAG